VTFAWSGWLLDRPLNNDIEAFDIDSQGFLAGTPVWGITFGLDGKKNLEESGLDDTAPRSRQLNQITEEI